MEETQHCPRCPAEYVAGVRECAECGGPLKPGPLPDSPPRSANETGARHEQATRGSPGLLDPPDTLLVTLPGLQAEFATNALILEGIPCLLECESLRDLRLPGQGPVSPFAVTLPVEIYVPRAHVEEARRILESLERDDLVEEQWQADGRPAAAGSVARQRRFDPRPMDPAGSPTPLPGAEPRLESAALQWALIVVGAIILIALFAL